MSHLLHALHPRRHQRGALHHVPAARPAQQADQQGREALFRDKVLEKRQQLGSQAEAYLDQVRAMREIAARHVSDEIEIALQQQQQDEDAVAAAGGKVATPVGPASAALVQMMIEDLRDNSRDPELVLALCEAMPTRCLVHPVGEGGGGGGGHHHHAPHERGGRRTLCACGHDHDGDGAALAQGGRGGHGHGGGHGPHGGGNHGSGGGKDYEVLAG